MMLPLCRLLLIAILLTLCLQACSLLPEENSLPLSDHYDGKRFYNRLPGDKPLQDVIGFGLQYPLQREPWPDWVDEASSSMQALPNNIEGVVVTLINHSSVLIQVDGLTLLTDPVYSLRASPFEWVGPKRVREPGLAFAQLPAIDMILISHDHYDHLDLPTLQAIQDRDVQIAPPVIIAGIGTQKLLESAGLRSVITLDWNESIQRQGVEVIFSESRHRSGRWVHDQMQRLWGAFVIKTRHGNIYFAGDTGYGPHFSETGKQHGPFVLSLLPIGAYEPRWFMEDIHMNPADAVQAHRDLNSQRSIGIHHSTFQLTIEGITQPMHDLDAARRLHQMNQEDFTVVAFGEPTLIVGGYP